MKKVTPSPPYSLNNSKLHEAAQRALFTVRAGLSTEEALSNACEMLESAAVSAYDCTEHLEGSSRKQVMAVVQLIEMAQLLVEAALHRECPAA